MANSVSTPQFKDEKAAFAYVEAHIWADGRYASLWRCRESKPMNGKTPPSAVQSATPPQALHRAHGDHFRV